MEQVSDGLQPRGFTCVGDAVTELVGHVTGRVVRPSELLAVRIEDLVVRELVTVG